AEPDSKVEDGKTAVKAAGSHSVSAPAQATATQIVGEARAQIQPKSPAPAAQPPAEPMSLTFSLDPENLPWEKTRELIRTHEKAGTLVQRFSFKYSDAVMAWGIPLELEDGSTKLMVIEYVPAGWFSKPRYRLAGIAPVTVNPQAALDVFVFDPHHIKGAQQTAAVLEFALHIIPLGGFADHASKGEWGEATISIAGDVAMVMTGGASKAITTSVKGQKMLRVSGAAIEGSIATYRGGQGAYKLYNGQGGYGEVGEALLRLFGVKMTLSQKVHVPTNVKATAPVTSRVANGVGDVLPIVNQRLKCFTPDTLVSTEHGPRPIAEIEPGDRIYAFDFALGTWTLADVEHRHDNQYEGPMLTIEAGGNRLRTTTHHPFWVVDGRDLDDRSTPRGLAKDEDQDETLTGRWVNSHELRAGDVIFTQEGERLPITSIEQTYEPDISVCNLTIAKFHTFAVGGSLILVHNTSWCDIFEQIKIANPGKKHDELVALAKSEATRKAGNDNFTDVIRNFPGGKDALGSTYPGAEMLDPLTGTMRKTHGHHIVRKNGGAASVEAQDLLLKYDIDPFYGQQNLIFAPNRGHTELNEAFVLKTLKDAAADGGSHAEIQARLTNTLRKLGEQFIAGKNIYPG
ncbi:MAG: AHH domain-containing protein, partial [Planctomycetia bacterium]|nr:AHH domain-containing protein [Planctomycetia bacterium]